MTYSLMLLTPLVLQLAGLCFAVRNDPYIRREHRRTLLTVIVLVASLILQNLLEYRMEQFGPPLARTLAAIFGYSVRPVILLLFFYIVSDRKGHLHGWILAGLNAAVHLTALFSPVCFTITAENLFVRGPLGFTCHAVCALLLAELLYLTVKKSGPPGRSQLWIPLFNAGLIVASVAADSFLALRLPLSFLTVAVVSANVFYYIWLHLQFVREHEQALMAEQRIQIMMSQIQPHFLYNTLATIKALCRRDPETAAEITGKFGGYLRQNLESLGQSEPIPFSRELEHAQIYADIEMVRFDGIRVEYDVADDSFSLPPLTLQPLVENAIRHGVRGMEDGLVRVETRRVGDWHELTVSDNGAGFDPASLDGLDPSHIGMRNVRERLEKLCGGTMEIDSAPGAGTRITVRIPAAD